MGKEFELKYAANSASVLDAIEQTLGPGVTTEMTTTYYDTPQGDLSARKWTLRLRQEGCLSVVTMKTAGDGISRGKWAYDADSVEFAGTVLTDLGAPEELAELLDGGVVPVCGAKFFRCAIPAEQGDTVLEVALDRGKLFRGDRELPFWEVEVELKAGSEAVCTEFAAELARRFDLREESRSKFARAVML